MDDQTTKELCVRVGTGDLCQLLVMPNSMNPLGKENI